MYLSLRNAPNAETSPYPAFRPFTNPVLFFFEQTSRGWCYEQSKFGVENTEFSCALYNFGHFGGLKMCLKLLPNKSN